MSFGSNSLEAIGDLNENSLSRYMNSCQTEKGRHGRAYRSTEGQHKILFKRKLGCGGAGRCQVLGVPAKKFVNFFNYLFFINLQNQYLLCNAHQRLNLACQLLSDTLFQRSVIVIFSWPINFMVEPNWTKAGKLWAKYTHATKYKELKYKQ